MKSKLKSTGLFYAVVFMIGAAVNYVSRLADGMGPVAALLSFGEVLSLVLVAAIMLASAYVAFLSWLQPILFLLLTAVVIPGGGAEASSSFFGLGFFSVAVLLLFKLGFFSRFRVAKAALCVVYLTTLEVLANLNTKNGLYMAITPIFFIVAFILFLFVAFRDRIVVYLKEPKRQLSLMSKGLAEAEQHYIRGVISGKTVKEVAFEHSISESTVRNTLSRAYKKLGIRGKADVSGLAERYEIVD
jgi:DNA-binding CsgD family transcriptional regulator